MAEALFILEKGGAKSLDTYVQQHFFRFHNKLLLNEKTMRAGSNLDTTYLPFKGQAVKEL